jgi:hypothetical protein
VNALEEEEYKKWLDYATSLANTAIFLAAANIFFMWGAK